MSDSILQRRLVDIAERLKRRRSELGVADEQVLFLEEEAEDARLRALVSETPLAEVEARDARRHADALRRHRDAVAEAIEELVREQDSLLDRLAADTAPDTVTGQPGDSTVHPNDATPDKETTKR
ncbi:MAG: hypothetical protein R3A49_02180 [Acidimicrobiia bacterium]